MALPDKLTDNLNELSSLWLAAKEAEKEATEDRRRIEDRIKSLVGVAENLEGTETVDPDQFTIKIVGRIDRKVDSDKLQELAAEHGLSEHLFSLFRGQAFGSTGAGRNQRGDGSMHGIRKNTQVVVQLVGGVEHLVYETKYIRHFRVLDFLDFRQVLVHLRTELICELGSSTRQSLGIDGIHLTFVNERCILATGSDLVLDDDDVQPGFGSLVEWAVQKLVKSFFDLLLGARIVEEFVHDNDPVRGLREAG